MARSMEIPPLGSIPRDREEQCAGLEHLLYNYSFYRGTRSVRKYGREKGRWYETGSRGVRWLEGSEKGTTTKSKKESQGREGSGQRGKRVDNSQDRIVPGAKNRSIPECYRMVETRSRSSGPSVLHPSSENASERKLLYSRGIHMAVPTGAAVQHRR